MTSVLKTIKLSMFLCLHYSLSLRDLTCQADFRMGALSLLSQRLKHPNHATLIEADANIQGMFLTVFLGPLPYIRLLSAILNPVPAG